MFFLPRERRDVNRVSLVLCIDPHKNDAKMIQKKGKTGHFLAIIQALFDNSRKVFPPRLDKKNRPRVGGSLTEPK